MNYSPSYEACRLLSSTGLPEPPFPQDEEVSPSNPFLEEEEASRRDVRHLERALDTLMVNTSRRCPSESAPTLLSCKATKLKAALCSTLSHQQPLGACVVATVIAK